MKTASAFCFVLLLAISSLTAQQLPSQSNPPCAGMSATAFATWPQLGYDSCHTGYNPNEFIIGPSNVANLIVAWTYQTGYSIESIPAVANGILYVGSDDHYLYALNATTGTLVWKYPMNGTGYVWGQAVVVNGVVYMSFSSVLYALNANNGTLLWMYSGPANSWVTDPTVVNGVVYFGGGDGLYALNANTGALIWKSGDNTTNGTPAVVNGVVYVGCGSDGQTCALNATTGARLWISDKYYYGNLPVVGNGIVYLVSSDSRNGPGVSALRAGDGTFLWHFRTQYEVNGFPAVAYGMVYIATEDSYIYALDAQTGALRWKSYTDVFNYQSLAVANGVVYAVYYNFWAVNAMTGEVLWRDQNLSSGAGSPIVVNGMVYFGNDKLYALHLPGIDEKRPSRTSEPGAYRQDVVHAAPSSLR